MIKDCQDMTCVRTQLFLNTPKYTIFRNLFQEYKSNYNVAESMRLSENALTNFDSVV